MRVLTFKANPKTIFGIVLAITGIIVIILSFAGNHSEKTEPTSAAIGCANTQERVKYLNSVGWETDGNENKKQIIIPSKFNGKWAVPKTIQQITMIFKKSRALIWSNTRAKRQRFIHTA